MGLDRWQMEPDVEDCFTEESGGPVPDYVALPATPALAGIEEAASQMATMLCKEHADLPSFVLGLSDADHLVMCMSIIWGKPDSCPFPKPKK